MTTFKQSLELHSNQWEAIFLEIRPLAALYPSPHIYFSDWYNSKGHKCHEHTAPGDHWDRRSIKHFFLGGGYNAASGLILRDITQLQSKSVWVLIFYTQKIFVMMKWNKNGFKLVKRRTQFSQLIFFVLIFFSPLS